MDDIYDNLENYNEVNVVAELKLENKELKLKLDEYATSMDKLQKDFDKLATEFKNLEKNYSSLLKTARMEIERKTQTIMNLNIEKDMMVINSLQDKRNDSNVKRYVTKNKRISDKIKKNSNSKSTEKKNDSDYIPNDNLNLTNKDTIDVREVQNRLSGEEATSKVKKINKLDDVNKLCDSFDSYNKNKNERKENIKQVLGTHFKDSHKEDIQTQAYSIKKKRKSVLSNLDTKFSSDEEEENKYMDERNKIGLNLKDSTDIESFDNNYNNKQSTKASDTSEKHSDYKANRHGRYNGVDKYRNRDKHESHKRHRRYESSHSPERLHRKSKRDYLDDCHHKLEYSRSKLSETSVDGNYPHQHRNRESRFYYDREHHYDFERYRHQEKYASKHKLQNNFEGPSKKRSRNEFYNYPEEDRRKNKEIDFVEKQTIYDKTKQHQYTSCQSPDYAQTDNPIQPIREIMHTAVSKLEDPRLTQKKYGDITNNSRNIDLKVIDTTKWKTEPLKAPNTFLQQQPQLNSEVIKEVYMDIENPILNSSVESGAVISSESNEIIFKNVVPESCPKANESEFHIQVNIEQEALGESATYSDNILKTENHSKLKYPEVEDLDKDNHNNHLSQHMVSNSISTNDYWEKTKNNESNELTLRVDEYNHKKNLFNYDSDQHGNDSNVKNQKTLSNKELVEGDLELSDETSDNLAFQDQITEEKSIVDSEDGVKPRKKSHKHKEIDSKKCIKSRTLENKQISNQKSKSKKGKELEPENIKTKFSDLFGDSSSLITPEDLDIVTSKVQPQSSMKYDPMFEDAVDLNVEYIMQVQTLSKTKTENEMSLTETTSSNVLTDDVTVTSITKSKNTDKPIIDSKKKTFHSNDERKFLPDENEFVNIYKNLNSKVDAIEDPDVVKTVIISTGAQPQCLPSNESDLNLNEHTVIHEIANRNNIHLQSMPVTALPRNSSNSTTSTTVDNVSASEPNRISNEDNVASRVAQSSNIEVTDNQEDTDVPDVRIFVRRRRKVLKNLASSQS